ncbi:MAG: T9SS type A sorting domain-containing protein, partial [Bacteroidetes bacterium]|nr:T9SS type A sorting domain-containing protein [Bacteroidota bacterium]
TTISYTLTTGCAASKTITVNAAPLIYTVTGGGPYCAGDTGVHITLSGSTLGISYGIYDGPTLKGTKTGGGSSVDFGLFTAAATYTVTATNLTTTCASNMIGSATVTINPVPSAITGTAKVCAGLTTALSDATAGGTWSSSNTSLATVGTTGIVAGVAAGTPSVMYTLSTGCKATVTVTVNPVPAGISGAGSVCTGLSVSMSDATPSGTWSTPGTSVLTITSSGTVTGSSAGTTVIIYTLSTGCSASKSFTVNPLPLAISGPVSVCLNATATISDASAGGTWSSGNTTVATVDPSTGLVTGLSTGVVTMTYMLPTGCSIAGNMTVDPLPDAGTITGAGSVCIDSTVRLSDVSGGGVWSSQSTLISVVATTGVVKGLSPGTAEIWYKLTSVCGTDSTSANITVNNCHVLVPKLEGIAASVTVVPNPNDGVFNITGDLGVTDNSEVTLELTNMLGQVVYSNRIVAMHGIINEQVAMKNTLARGTYLLHVKSAEVNTVFHVVVDQ